jgi:hypothetical protein
MTMIALFKNRLAYLSLSLILLVAAFPLVSIGLSRGPAALWWLGLLALGCGGLIPPLQRILLGPPASEPQSDDGQPASRKGESKS